MDFVFTMVICLGIFAGYNSRTTDDYSIACDDGEEYDTCRSPCEPTCESVSNGSKINCSKPCIPGCFCRSGLVRAKDNTCVPPQDCIRPVCKENEEYRECGSPCVHNCSNFKEPIFCTKPCYPGCFCKLDFVRNSKGHCVHPSKCFTAPLYYRCGKNEVYKDCVSPCNTCWDLGSCKIRSCYPGCDCKPGFYKNSYGECVTKHECTTDYGLCGKNEEYTECVNPCNDCTYKGNCNYQNYYYCQPGCDCKRGYFKNYEGICVLEQFCYNTFCKENEVYLECGPSCPPTCENYRQVAYLPCSSECTPGCFCREDFVQEPGGRCIRPEYCTEKQPVCPPNEQYYRCMPVCGRTCDTHDNVSICDTTCRKGCFCKPGLVRKRDGACVPPGECPPKVPVCPPNEKYYNCIPVCRNSCDTFNTSQPCGGKCTKGCFCKDGLIRRRDGVCVPPRECPEKQPVCPPNEQYYKCMPACGRTCDTHDNISIICDTTCRNGCFCKPGLVRKRNGACVQPSECPPKVPVCPPNEKYYNCIPVCRNSCDTFNTSQPCTEMCIKGCFCKDGLIRRRDGVCVPPRECPVHPCPPGEAFYQCLPTCRNTCKTLNESAAFCSIEITCQSGCFCQPGFVRGENGQCIHPSQCPPIIRPCPAGEIFYNCTPTCRNSCDNLNSTRPCPEICRPGCFCSPGFVRRHDGQCVRPQNCPIVCGVNEQFLSCGTSCPATCDDLHENRTCIERCVRGCFCKSGFVRGPDGKCSQPINCPPVIPPCEPGISICPRRKSDEEHDTDTTTDSATTRDASMTTLDFNTTDQTTLTLSTRYSEATSVVNVSESTTIPISLAQTATTLSAEATNQTEDSITSTEITSIQTKEDSNMSTTVTPVFTDSENVTAATELTTF